MLLTLFLHVTISTTNMLMVDVQYVGMEMVGAVVNVIFCYTVLLLIVNANL
jgi:hypothetical protein